MTRRYLTLKERLAMIADQSGLCACGCGKPIDDTAEADHSTPHAWKPERKPDQLLCRECHKAKTRSDVKRIAKAKRLAAGGKKRKGPKIATRGFPRRPEGHSHNWPKRKVGR